MALYELTVFYPSDPVLDPMWRHGMFVVPFMTVQSVPNQTAKVYNTTKEIEKCST
jgi:hypothetical protein